MSSARLLLVVSFLIAGSTACAPAPQEELGTAEGRSVADIDSIKRRADGSFDITCADGRTEVATAVDVRADRVCHRPAMPASPFQGGACTGAPLDESRARARLASAGGVAVSVGEFAMAFRHRESRNWGNDWWSQYYVWVDAAGEDLRAIDPREEHAGRPTERAKLARRGTVELAADDQGAPYLRMVGEPVPVIGPDTTHFARLVSKPIRPWQGHVEGPELAIEVRQGQGSSEWKPAPSEWVVRGSRLVGNYDRSWWFRGTDVVAFATADCAQWISSQTTSGMAATSLAIGIYASLSL